MAVKHALAAALLFLPLAACSSSGRTAEIPDGPTDGAEAPRTNQRMVGQAPPGWLEEMFGNDDRPNSGPCPLMGVLYDSARIVQFGSAEQRYANISYTGEMRGVRGFCRYVDANPIQMNLEIEMAFGRGGGAGETRSQRFRYWVAVVRRGRAPIEKQYYDIQVDFPSGQQVVSGTERIQNIVIPRANADVSGDNFEILVGFELTPEQLEFNRDGRRFRIDAANPAPG